MKITGANTVIPNLKPSLMQLTTISKPSLILKLIKTVISIIIMAVPPTSAVASPPAKSYLSMAAMSTKNAIGAKTATYFAVFVCVFTAGLSLLSA